MSDLGSTRTGWALIVGGAAFFTAAMILAVVMPMPWGYALGITLGMASGSIAVTGITERHRALKYRRQMNDILIHKER